MSISLREVGYDILDSVIELKVREDQKDLINDNKEAMAQAGREQDFFPWAIYSDDTLVGFCMYSVDEDDGRVIIESLMIDGNHQGKGYSREAVTLMVDAIVTQHNPAKIYTYITPNNLVAEKIFSRLGFEKSVESGDAQLVYVLRLSS